MCIRDSVLRLLLEQQQTMSSDISNINEKMSNSQKHFNELRDDINNIAEKFDKGFDTKFSEMKEQNVKFENSIDVNFNE